ncbi:MAG: phosphotransferase, partial [Acidimicrobiales bacterium]
LRSRLDALERVVDADPCRRRSSVEPEIAAARAAAPLVALSEELTAAVPVRVAHNDAKLDNILFRGTAAVCIVDLDTLMPGAWFWDVGDLVRTAGSTAAEDRSGPEPATVDHTLHGAVMAGYRRGVSTGPMTSAEHDALDLAGAVVTYEQGVRFLTDFLSGDRYYRTDRPGHNRDRAQTQFQLLASLPGVGVW